MTIRQPFLRTLALAALLWATGVAQAAIGVTTSATTFSQATSAGAKGTDNFADLTINTFLTGPLSRSAGAFGYSVDTTPAGADGLFVIPNAGNPALSLTNATDTLTFTLDALTPVLAFGGNFFGSNALGEVASGSLNLVVKDSFNNTLTQTFTLSGSTSNFIGFLSDAPITSVAITANQPGGLNSLWPTIDNMTVAATVVPEPGAIALMLTSLGLLGVVARRRPRA